MQLFCLDNKMFFFAHKKLKNPHPQKLLRKPQIQSFYLTAWAAQTTQREEFMFQNVAFRPTVYRTGDSSNKLVFSVYDLSSLGCEWLLSAVFPKIVTALKKHMTCYNFNLNFLFYYSQKLQTAINKFQNCLEVF